MCPVNCGALKTRARGSRLVLFTTIRKRREKIMAAIRPRVIKSRRRSGNVEMLSENGIECVNVRSSSRRETTAMRKESRLIGLILSRLRNFRLRRRRRCRRQRARTERKISSFRIGKKANARLSRYNRYGWNGSRSVWAEKLGGFVLTTSWRILGGIHVKPIRWRLPLGRRVSDQFVRRIGNYANWRRRRTLFSFLVVALDASRAPSAVSTDWRRGIVQLLVVSTRRRRRRRRINSVSSAASRSVLTRRWWIGRRSRSTTWWRRGVRFRILGVICFREGRLHSRDRNDFVCSTGDCDFEIRGVSVEDPIRTGVWGRKSGKNAASPDEHMGTSVQFLR